LLECIRLANNLLTQFVERVLGKDRELVFKDEMDEINRIAKFHESLEQKEQILALKTERLQDVKEQLAILKSKMN
jgi:hypothetical protein